MIKDTGKATKEAENQATDTHNLKTNNRCPISMTFFGVRSINDTFTGPF